MALRHGPITKYRPPTTAGALVVRDRLVARLAQHRHRRLALIHAPAGFGKTTLALQWFGAIRSAGGTAAWLSIGADDENSTWFVAHLVEALQHAALDDGEDLLALLEEGAGSTPLVLSTLIDRLDDAPELTVFLDDWHRVTDPDTHAVLAYLLESAPAHVHFVITSRTRAGIPLGVLRVGGQLNEIDAGDLRFDPAESEDFLVAVHGLPLDGVQVERLRETTEGWAAALQLASLSLRTAQDSSALIERFHGAEQTIDEYLAQAVLDRIDARTLHVLLRTSVVERVNADLVSVLAGVDLGQQMLEEIEDRNLFLRHLDDDREWFAYHHLFAEFLRHRLHRDHPDEVSELHRRAARWFSAHGHTGEAVQHAVASADMEFALDILEKDAMRLVEHSRMTSVLALARRLPARELATRPRLQIALAWANCLLQRSAEARACLEIVERLCAARPAGGLDEADREDVLREARVVDACVDIYADRTSGVIERLGDYVDIAGEIRPWIVAVAANIESYAHIQHGDLTLARRRQEWALPYQEWTDGPFAWVYGRCFAGIAALEQLDTDAAESAFVAASERAAAAVGRLSHADRLAGALLGDLRYHQGELVEAERLLSESYELGAESGVVEFMLASYATHARVRARRGEPERARMLLEEGAEVGLRLGLPRLCARIDLEWVVLGLEGGPREAREGADGSEAASALRRERAIRRMLDPAAAEFDPDRALEVCRGASRRLGAASRSGLRMRMLTACALAAAGEADSALPEFATVAITAHQRRLPLLVADGGRFAVELLRRLAGQSVVGGASEAAEILRLADAAPAPSAPGIDLSEREGAVLALLDRGLTNREIAAELFLAADTVKWYLKSLYTKLGVGSRVACLARARQVGLLRTLAPVAAEH